MSAQEKPSPAAAMTVARAVAELHGATTSSKVVVEPFVVQLQRALDAMQLLASAAKLAGKPLAICHFLDQMVIDLRALLEQSRGAP